MFSIKLSGLRDADEQRRRYLQQQQNKFFAVALRRVRGERGTPRNLGAYTHVETLKFSPLAIKAEKLQKTGHIREIISIRFIT
jgi:hypothetical protein